MSPTVNNFVHDLVAMAKAMEDLPQVQAQLDFVRTEHDKALITIQSREDTILRLKAEIEAHLATIRKTEAERDHAEIRFLELDEKASGALRMVKTAMDQLDQVVVKIEPPMPVPVPVPQETTGTMPAPAEGQSEPLPTSVNTMEQKDVVPDNTATTQDDVNTLTQASSGANPEVTKSEADPTVATDQTEPVIPQGYADGPVPASTLAPVDPTPAVGSALSPPTGKYFGMRYSQVPYYVPFSLWLDGGGADADYHH